MEHMLTEREWEFAVRRSPNYDYIRAIREIRGRLGLGLKEAKDAVDFARDYADKGIVYAKYQVHFGVRKETLYQLFITKDGEEFACPGGCGCKFVATLMSLQIPVVPVSDLEMDPEELEEPLEDDDEEEEVIVDEHGQVIGMAKKPVIEDLIPPKSMAEILVERRKDEEKRRAMRHSQEESAVFFDENPCPPHMVYKIDAVKKCVKCHKVF